MSNSSKPSVPEMSKEIPITYVPMRNTIFLTLAAAFLESIILDKIENQGEDPGEIEAHLVIAANALDYSGYPDCRPEFYHQFQQFMKVSNKLAIQYEVPVLVDTPLLQMTKREIVEYATSLEAPLGLTWSCYSDSQTLCGKCDSCQLRAKGFQEAGLEDPILK